MMGIELLHESSEVLHILVHGPCILLIVSTNKAIASSNLDVKDHKIGEAVPGVWIFKKSWDATSGLVDLELVWSHLA